jgi:hypothetical protein
MAMWSFSESWNRSMERWKSPILVPGSSNEGSSGFNESALIETNIYDFSQREISPFKETVAATAPFLGTTYTSQLPLSRTT